MTTPSACGCRSCGGPSARADALLARRVLAYAPFIAARRRSTRDALAARSVVPTLYSATLLRGTA